MSSSDRPTPYRMAWDPPWDLGPVMQVLYLLRSPEFGSAAHRMEKARGWIRGRWGTWGVKSCFGEIREACMVVCGGGGAAGLGVCMI